MEFTNKTKSIDDLRQDPFERSYSIVLFFPSKVFRRVILHVMHDHALQVSA